jgi:predicted SAM-dependent methyltransferase/glycosyltransferase involved in cell wall biosynthesis
VRRPQDEIWPHSRGTIHSLLRSPRCRGVITINSNVAHDALLWDVPVVVLGRNVWPQEGVHKPFLRQVPANWDELQESVRSSTARECRLAYARYLVTNQWTLADARIESRVEALLRSATGQASQARSPAPVAKPTRLAPVVARAEGAASGPIVNVVAEDRGWLFESWKKRFRAVSRSDLEVVVSEKPVGHAAAWIFIRAREARHSPDLSRTVVQIHDSFGPELYRGNGERSHVARCGALCLSHPSQEAVLRSAGISLDRRLWRVQPVGYAPCAQVASEPRREATVAWIGRPGAPGREDPSHTDFFVAAVSRLGRDVQVVLVGERLGELSARLSAMGVSCSVRNTSRYPLERCAQWIREFDCVAITSETDAGPWPLFDALYAGVPVVSRPVGWAKDLLSDGCAGRIVTDPESMGQAIREIVSSRAVRTGPREEALHALQERSIDAWIEANLALARRLIETHEGGGAHTLRADSAVKLDIGCGGKPRAGFTGVDVRPLPGVGVVCNAWELDRHVPPASVSAIYGRHFFEHLTYAQGRAALLAFHKVLRPDGELHLIVPDILYHARQLLHPNPHAPSEHSARWTHREHAIGSLWGWQRGESNELWDVHKAGYDEELLGKTLREAGFTRIRRLPDRPWNLSLTCRRG